MRAPLNSSPISPRRRASALVGVLSVAVLLLAGCGGDDGDEESTDGEATTETTAPSSSTTEAATTEGTDAPSSETTASTPEDDGGGDGDGDGDTSTTEPTGGQLSPGDACSLEEGDPDCIDPDGDGEGVYLIGGADCAATAPDISVCEDLDGDGTAGYPDSEYGDLPVCSDEVPPPCNNPPGEGDDG